ncbi:2-amino-4-hydroxy-6-hydroxymethyldihydropteridine pyrophosphokinase [Hydrogenimonas sp.]|nr:2-amino-4-hydroxy-6-hydroxymethyldihydropteridine pyrophosphokinase [Hydrogenimonas sp.]
MKLKRENGRSLFRGRGFPKRFPPAGMPHLALVGIGGNMGDVEKRFEKVLRYLKSSRVLRPLETSLLFENPPFGYIDQPYFINSVILVETVLKPHALMRYLLWVERRFGRKRSFPNAPRTLDLDIIFFDNLQLKSRRLTLPHPHFAERESVMVPLRFMSAAIRPK